MRPKNIAWEKWFDINPELDNEIQEQDIEDFFNSEMDDEENSPMPINGIQIFSQPIKVRTPIGFFELDEPLSPSVMFDCWICHTNFPITDDIFFLLDNEIEGIECLKIMSKYRFFIGIGKLFDSSEVKMDIQNRLMTHEEDKEIKNSGFVFIYNSGECKFFDRNDFEDEESYAIKLDEFKKSKDGRLLSEI